MNRRSLVAGLSLDHYSLQGRSKSMHSSLSPQAPTPPHRVFCGGLPFLIIDGRRVWSTEPPTAIQHDLLANDFYSTTADRSLDRDRNGLPDGGRS